MHKFVQLHLLTAYPVANLNRDDLGTPKTVRMGNTNRLRVSSQSLKRAWRTAEAFQQALGGNLGTRTKELGAKVYLALTLGRPLQEILAGQTAPGGLAAVKEKLAADAAAAIAGVFGKVKGAKDAKKDSDADQSDAGKQKLAQFHTEQLVHLSPQELADVAALVEVVRTAGKAPEKDSLALLRNDIRAADIAMFGRMVAASPSYNQDAAVQVAHGFTVHASEAQDDFFTAVDDLNRDESGAGHMGVLEFGSGLFYQYICVDTQLLQDNLGGDATLAKKALAALVTAAATVAPTGKQASFASRAYASYILAERGDWQPRSLALAFLEPLTTGGDLHKAAVDKLNGFKKHLDHCYGIDIDDPKMPPDNRNAMNALAGEGSLAQIISFVTE